jgi:hypothetical protein
MNRDEIVRLAREAGISVPWDQEPVRWQLLERFAVLVAEQEREEMGKDFLDFYRMMVMLGDKESAMTAEHCMSLIRMRSKSKST